MVYKVLLAPISTNGLCSISFCASMVQFQNQLAKESGLAASVMFFESAKEAETAFANGAYDAIVMMDTKMGVPTSFLVTPPRYDCEISPYPMPTIDWDRVERKIAATTERPEWVGNVYNFDASLAVPVDSKFARVSKEHVKECAVIKLRRGVTYQSVQEVYVDLANPSVNHGTVAYTGCVGARKTLR